MKPILLLITFISLTAISHGQTTTAPITAKDDGQTIQVDNGILSLTFSKQSAQITSIKRRDGDTINELGSGKESQYWDSNSEAAVLPEGVTAPKKGYSRLDPIESVEILENTPDIVRIVAKGGPGKWLKFRIECHWTIFRGDSGFYSYVVIRHPADQPKATFYQTRFVSKFITDGTFTHQIIRNGALQEIPTSAIKEQLMDATYLLEDGSVKTKYNNSTVWADVPVYGVVGKRFGLWSISASSEYYNGAPIKQGQTTHDNVLLRVLQSVHFGAAPVVLDNGEEWSKIYGPFLTYTNVGDDPQDLWKDAVKRQQDDAAKWPFTWVKSDLYAKKRGTVSGQWKLPNGPAKLGALVVLAAPGGDWPLQGKAYQYFTRTGPDGQFTIPKVAPGTYTLYAIGADQPDQIILDNVTVRADADTHLDTITWPSASSGKTLWQLGTFDRSAAEFRDGSDSRNFEMFRLYPKSFPDDVDFTIGKSDPAKDWSYAQWTWYSKTPMWKLRFNQEQALPKGNATLTIGISAAQPLTGDKTQVKVTLNGKTIGNIRLEKTGTSGYRGGAGDTKYNVIRLTIPTEQIQSGENIIGLEHENARPFEDIKGKDVAFNVGHVMYDAIKLEVPQEEAISESH